MPTAAANPTTADNRSAVVLRDAPVAKVCARIRDSARLDTRNGVSELTFNAMGTRCRVSFTIASSPATVANTLLAWVGTFEARYSRFLPDSWISQINSHAGKGWVTVDAELSRLLALSGQMVFLSRGALDPTAAPVIQLWDWKTGRVPSDAEVETARSLVGWRKVQTAPDRVCLPTPGISIDLGGVGKEYAVDQTIGLLASLGVRSALVDYGADIRVLGLPADGRPAWKIGLEDPRNPGNAWTHFLIRDGAVATSGNYLRRFEAGGHRYGHIVDPRTGRPTDNGVIAASVWAPSCTQAGMLSTALCVLGMEEGRRLLLSTPGVEGCLLTEHGLVASTRFHEHVST
jgi:thiamine biosynthesis lipoprotein